MNVSAPRRSAFVTAQVTSAFSVPLWLSTVPSVAEKALSDFDNILTPETIAVNESTRLSM